MKKQQQSPELFDELKKDIEKYEKKISSEFSFTGSTISQPYLKIISEYNDKIWEALELKPTKLIEQSQDQLKKYSKDELNKNNMNNGLIKLLYRLQKIYRLGDLFVSKKKLQKLSKKIQSLMKMEQQIDNQKQQIGENMHKPKFLYIVLCQKFYSKIDQRTMSLVAQLIRYDKRKEQIMKKMKKIGTLIKDEKSFEAYLQFKQMIKDKNNIKFIQQQFEKKKVKKNNIIQNVEILYNLYHNKVDNISDPSWYKNYSQLRLITQHLQHLKHSVKLTFNNNAFHFEYKSQSQNTIPTLQNLLEGGGQVAILKKKTSISNKTLNFQKFSKICTAQKQKPDELSNIKEENWVTNRYKINLSKIQGLRNKDEYQMKKKIDSIQQQLRKFKQERIFFDFKCQNQVSGNLTIELKSLYIPTLERRSNQIGIIRGLFSQYKKIIQITKDKYYRGWFEQLEPKFIQIRNLARQDKYKTRELKVQESFVYNFEFQELLLYQIIACNNKISPKENYYEKLLQCCIKLVGQNYEKGCNQYSITLLKGIEDQCKKEVKLKNSKDFKDFQYQRILNSSFFWSDQRIALQTIIFSEKIKFQKNYSIFKQIEKKSFEKFLNKLEQNEYQNKRQEFLSILEKHNEQKINNRKYWVEQLNHQYFRNYFAHQNTMQDYKEKVALMKQFVPQYLVFLHDYSHLLSQMNIFQAISNLKQDEVNKIFQMSQSQKFNKRLKKKLMNEDSCKKNKDYCQLCQQYKSKYQKKKLDPSSIIQIFKKNLKKLKECQHSFFIYNKLLRSFRTLNMFLKIKKEK